MQKWIFAFALVGNILYGFAQTNGWQNMDLQKDSVFGISTRNAYGKFLMQKKTRRIIVAVIDGGIDTTHEFLKPVLWSNRIERLNGVDDDKNGYIDDIHGWNFIGGVTGDVEFDNLELTRILRSTKGYYDSLSYTAVPDSLQKRYQQYRMMKSDYDGKKKWAAVCIERINHFQIILDSITRKMGNLNPGLHDFESYKAANEGESNVLLVVINNLRQNDDFKKFVQDQVIENLQHYQNQLKYQLNFTYDPRTIVGDNYADIYQQFYGNNDVCGPHANHGTHVAGIITQMRRDPGDLIDSSVDIQIMCIRAVPDGDERDKDISNAIRYAVNNGTKIINMSFGKLYSPDKIAVDNAVQYAMGKDVLIVHAAGNDSKDLDGADNRFYPDKYYLKDSSIAGAWITVGASGWKDDSSLVASFSNYGKYSVDVFAPGVQIYSTVPGSKYEKLDGTSMAAPVVSGLAALIWEYYPKLTAIQVKDIIMKSVVKRDILKDKCVSGGVVNAYNALKLAATYK